MESEQVSPQLFLLSWVKSHFTMFFLLWILPQQLFFPLNFFLWNQYCLENDTSKKWGQKRPPNAKSLACGFAFTWQLSFYAIAHESVFYVVSQEAKEQFFYVILLYHKGVMATICMWYREDAATANHCNMWTVDCKKRWWQQSYFYVVLLWASNDNHIFYIALQGSKGIQQKFKHRTRCEGVLQRYDDHTTIKCCMSYCKMQQHQYLFHVELQWASKDDYIFYVISQGGERQYNKSQPSRGCEGQLQGYGNDGPPRNNQIYNMLSNARSKDNEHKPCRIAREATTVIVLMLQEAVLLQRSEQHDDTIARRKDATIKHYSCCWSQGWQQQALSTARMRATCVPYVVL